MIPLPLHSAAVKAVFRVGGGGVVGIGARAPRVADVTALDAGIRIGHLVRHCWTEAVCPTAKRRRALRG